ncbi:hypothetical protein SSX86_006377 [Deinandra increscens subsp. villosa]|uniref:Retrotransposon gag domain-containing protein n=1 Tax=Deinandra increscens subsp. villosa TaxID=3103831 RepID=A0AAP0H3P5_9ASTR
MSNPQKAVSASTSSSIPPIPSLSGSQKKTNDRQKKVDEQPRKTDYPVFTGSQVQSVDPVITNNDLFSLIKQVKNQMDQQEKTNLTVMKEIEELKKSRKPMEEQSPLFPRHLDFNASGSSDPSRYNYKSASGFTTAPTITSQAAGNVESTAGFSGAVPPESSQSRYKSPWIPPLLGSSALPSQGYPFSVGNPSQNPQGYQYSNPSVSAGIFKTSSSEVHDGDVIPMQTATTTEPSFPAGYGYGSGIPVQNPDPGNMSNSIPIVSNQGAPYDAGIHPSIARELQKLKEMISNVPGILKPIPEVPLESHKISRFAWPISQVEIPKRFQTPSMKLYDGTTDPEEHVAHYRERMEINPIPAGIKEACLCKGFGSTLTGPAMKWLLSIPPNTITSFSHLVNLFNNQFSCSRTFEKLTGDLYRIIQKPDEPLRDYIARFGRESLEIPNLDMAAAVEAFKMGLSKDSRFYDDLVMAPCRNLDEVRSRALRFIRLEDDKRIHQRLEVPKYDPNSKKAESPGKPYRSRPYSKPENHKVNAVDQDDDEEEYPKVSEYCFSVDIGGLMCAMQDLGEKARWPRKDTKQGSWKDKTKWCAFHEDFGHLTDECIALRKEISYLLSKGHLKELIGRKKVKTQETDKVPQRAASPPQDAQIINFISGGSDICGTSYSSAKKHAKESKSEQGDKPVRTSTLTQDKLISFDESDRSHVQDPHHDSLVVTLYIANHFVRRILIDNGSSVNIIRLDVLKKMGIPETEIVARSSVLVGFSGETKSTVGDIRLPVYIEGVNSMQKFCVIDSLSCCNIILGRPWIHEMKAVPSTYHQCIKLPTPWGVVRIESDQQEAKNCYSTSMKNTTKVTKG